MTSNDHNAALTVLNTKGESYDGRRPEDQALPPARVMMGLLVGDSVLVLEDVEQALACAGEAGHREALVRPLREGPSIGVLHHASKATFVGAPRRYRWTGGLGWLEPEFVTEIEPEMFVIADLPVQGYLHRITVPQNLSLVSIGYRLFTSDDPDAFYEIEIIAREANMMIAASTCQGSGYGSGLGATSMVGESITVATKEPIDIFIRSGNKPAQITVFVRKIGDRLTIAPEPNDA